MQLCFLLAAWKTSLRVCFSSRAVHRSKLPAEAWIVQTAEREREAACGRLEYTTSKAFSRRRSGVFTVVRCLIRRQNVDRKRQFTVPVF